MANTLIYTGKAENAIAFVKKAMRLDPQYPAYYLLSLGLAYFNMDEFEKALKFLERAVKRNPENYVPLIPLAAVLAHLDRVETAKTVIAKLKKALPEASVSLFMGCPLWRYKNLEDRSRLLKGLQKAGLETYPKPWETKEMKQHG
jgi:tetratricopeptide (TPR) repeat protein